MSELLLTENVVDGISDKEDKTWERAKVIMKEMPMYQANLLSMQSNLMPEIQEDASKIKEAPEGDITRFLD